MNTYNENAHYDHQSFDQYPTAPMYPAGWDLSALHPTPTVDSASEADDSAENETCQS
ncbi:MAG TPA: hypothetical protein PLV64_19270 [Anaerolineales bacterium]|jgi:hypothetical protein|nr:hypothetical protein [Anaerolineales bacterium]